MQMLLFCSAHGQGVQFAVDSVFLLHQFLVRAPLDNLSAGYNRNLVGRADGGETVRHDDGGPAGAQFVQRLLDEDLG